MNYTYNMSQCCNKMQCIPQHSNHSVAFILTFMTSEVYYNALMVLLHGCSSVYHLTLRGATNEAKWDGLVGHFYGNILFKIFSLSHFTPPLLMHHSSDIGGTPVLLITAHTENRGLSLFAVFAVWNQEKEKRCSPVWWSCRSSEMISNSDGQLDWLCQKVTKHTSQQL